MSLNNNSLFDTLFEYGNYQEKKAGEEIFTYQEKADKIYIIFKGLVGLFTKDKAGKETEIDRLSLGNFFGVVSLLEENNVYSSRSLAHQDTILFSFSPAELKQLIKKEADLNQRLLIDLCQRVKTLYKPKKELAEIDIINENEPKRSPKKTIKEEAGEFYLPGHGSYNQLAKDSFKKYLYSKEIECPVCATNFEIKKIRNSKLRKKETRDDLRPVYKEINPIWYEIWICPQCFYTARKRDYFDWRSSQKEKIKNNFKAEIKDILGKDYQPGYSQPRRIDEVFDAYYLCLKSYQLIEVKSDKIASLWLRLNWLYEDIGEDKLSNQASLKALKYLDDYYFNSYSNRSQAEEDKIALLLGVMLDKHNKDDKALKLLGELVHKSGTKPVYKRLAKDKYMEIREKQRN